MNKGRQETSVHTLNLKELGIDIQKLKNSDKKEHEKLAKKIKEITYKHTIDTAFGEFKDSYNKIVDSVIEFSKTRNSSDPEAVMEAASEVTKACTELLKHSDCKIVSQTPVGKSEVRFKVDVDDTVKKMLLPLAAMGTAFLIMPVGDAVERLVDKTVKSMKPFLRELKNIVSDTQKACEDSKGDAHNNSGSFVYARDGKGNQVKKSVTDEELEKIKREFEIN